VHLVSAGKAAWLMAHAFCAERRVESGVVSGLRVPGRALPEKLVHYDGGHPSPNSASDRAARGALQIAAVSREGGTLVVLLSGGASAMLAGPAAGITLEDKATTAQALMSAGVAIDGLNCVRKHLSTIKGGRLARAARRVLTLAISDVHWPIEDDPTVIGSGPTVADPSTFTDALDVIRRAGAPVPEAVTLRLVRGARGELDETPKPGAPGLEQSTYHIIGGRAHAMLGARARALALGYTVVVVEKPTRGEARDAATAFVESALHAGLDRTMPLCVIASGETTVRVRGDGRGGRNQEFALAAVPALARSRSAVLASIGTDGIDGPTDAAGAVVDSGTEARARHAGLSWEDALARSGAYDFFHPLGDLVTWGPTGTNVGDVQVMVVDQNW
jgi:glycerate 2-kinase